MKVRWTDLSVRLRITPTELSELVRGLSVATTLPLTDDTVWAIRLQPGAATTRLESGPTAILVALTAGDVERLCDGDTEGVYFWSEGEPPIRYYVEKDFPCEHPHPVEVCEPETERFAPTDGYLRRKHGKLAGHR